MHELTTKFDSSIAYIHKPIYYKPLCICWFIQIYNHEAAAQKKKKLTHVDMGKSCKALFITQSQFFIY